MRLILLSGMATDERLFGPQLARFPELTVPRWLPPRPDESVRGYAARMADSLRIDAPCVIGGASFGGIVAQELVAHLPTVGCVLIGSIRSPAELPWSWRAARPLGLLGPERMAALAGLATRVGGPVLPRGTVRGLQKLALPEAAFVRWAMCAVLRWNPSPVARRARVFHIHGELDRTLPARFTRPDVIVPGGGHALTLTNPVAVNEYLERVLQQTKVKLNGP